jgi:hypothetical protein
MNRNLICHIKDHKTSATENPILSKFSLSFKTHSLSLSLPLSPIYYPTDPFSPYLMNLTPPLCRLRLFTSRVFPLFFLLFLGDETPSLCHLRQTVSLPRQSSLAVTSCPVNSSVG